MIQLRFQKALLLYPIPRRIDELLAVFRECSIKELQIFYPVLIENIFGISATTPGWKLRTITRLDSPMSFDMILRFFHPGGPLIDIAYKLLSDIYLKYHYSLSYLPPSFRQLIESGNVPPFYVDKLQMDPTTRAPQSLLLNSFELYMFHFSFHLVSPWEVRSDRPTSSSNETVYLHLTDQYLSHFLPIETSVVLPMVLLNQNAPRSPPPQVQPVRISKLFKSPTLTLNTTAQSVGAQSHAEIWRSESLLHIIIYFWLYVPDELRTLNTSQMSPSRSHYSSFNNSNSSMNPQFSFDWQESRVTGEHLRIVRNLIKHMHYFANNLRNDASFMDEMRRTIRSVLQIPIYNFLKHNIHHWPLDSSFLLMLETYLSYIQPWRYQRYDSVTQTGQGTTVDSIWLSYITDNLEAYTSIVAELLSRFLRMDLSSPRHAHMVYRLSKVLAEPNLPSLLRKADLAAQENHVVLFTSATEEKVSALLRTLTRTMAILSTAEMNAQEKKNLSFMQRLREWFLLLGNADYSSTDRKTTLAYLEHTINWLSAVFNVYPPDAADQGTTASVQPSMLDPALAQKRVASIKYGGNPDLEPIRSTEVASLVRLFLRLSRDLNEAYGHQIAELWHRQDLKGRISREFLAPPCQYFYFHKTGPGNPAPRVSLFLPPRVCLRPLASRGRLIFWFIIIIFPLVFRCTPVLFYLISFLIFALVVFGRVVLSPYFERGGSNSESGPFVPLDVSFQE